MKTKDRIKEEIGLEKLLLTLLVAIASSLSSWAWSNKDFTHPVVTVILCFTIFILAIMTPIIFIKINLKIAKLDKYES